MPAELSISNAYVSFNFELWNHWQMTDPSNSHATHSVDSGEAPGCAGAGDIIMASLKYVENSTIEQWGSMDKA